MFLPYRSIRLLAVMLPPHKHHILTELAHESQFNIPIQERMAATFDAFLTRRRGLKPSEAGFAISHLWCEVAFAAGVSTSDVEQGMFRAMRLGDRQL